MLPAASSAALIPTCRPLYAIVSPVSPPGVNYPQRGYGRGRTGETPEGCPGSRGLNGEEAEDISLVSSYVLQEDVLLPHLSA